MGVHSPREGRVPYCYGTNFTAWLAGPINVCQLKKTASRTEVVIEICLGLVGFEPGRSGVTDIDLTKQIDCIVFL